MIFLNLATQLFSEVPKDHVEGENWDMNEYLENFINTKFRKSSKALDLGAGDFCDVKNLEKLGWECEGVDLEMGIDLEKPYVSKNKFYG